MTFALTKHHGLGNDFLVALDEVDPGAAGLGPADARRLCDRRTGIGADGLIRGAPAAAGSDVDLVMHLWNNDGSRAEMSGNGIRCLAHAVLLARHADRLRLAIGTDAGTREVEVRRDGGDSVSVRVAMGPANPGPPIPAEVHQRYAVNRMATVDVGNPHLVIEVPDPSAIDLAADGPWAEAQFPHGVNVEYIAAGAEPDALDLVVWERGAGITRACGTGATAAAATAHEWGTVGRVVEVRMPGGSAQVEVGRELTLIGPSVLVAQISVQGLEEGRP